MKKQQTIVIIGGGYAGINAIDALKKEKFNKDYRIVLIDKQPNHFKKVKLFKGIVDEDFSELFIPFSNYCTDGVEFLQGELKAVNHEKQKIEVLDVNGEMIHLHYDLMIMTLGSVIKEVNPIYGGTTLSSLQNARKIRQDLLNELSDKSKLRISIIGAGITGIETSAEIATWLRNEAEQKGLKASDVEIYLLNQHDRLMLDIPEKVSRNLEKRLKNSGVTTIHHINAHKFENSKIYYNEGSEMASDYCIWTVGMQPHPCLQDLGLPLMDHGKLLIDSWYRLKGCKNIYSIGDCAHIVDSSTGQVAGMTCKEAVAEAKSLAKIIKADLAGYGIEGHKAYPSLYCIGLGPTDGFFWAQKWGMDFVLTGKLGVKMRDFTWNIASLVN
ncbi:NAD(P)/FAD-dependent oxidoreductase [Peribacillus alkalitolerans]|uniref:NAD(P)/FAD-dependent oxidoreductase n=1 Tax=Peribacillus alkalitolerans TaxID=1550385 RepID=UPI0013D36342|nr:FAD-dependent oxidoreductase [Peribacillus alkalitolerans]